MSRETVHLASSRPVLRFPCVWVQKRTKAPIFLIHPWAKILLKTTLKILNCISRTVVCRQDISVRHSYGVMMLYVEFLTAGAIAIIKNRKMILDAHTMLLQSPAIHAIMF